LYYFFRPWILNPKTRYRLAERYDNLLYNLVPVSGSGAQGSKAVLVNNREFTEHTGSYNIMSKKILQAANSYAELKRTQIPSHKIDTERENLLRSFNLA
jgi:hypothetical protein